MKPIEKVAWIVFIMLLLLTIISGILALNVAIVFTWFSSVPMCLLCITIIMGFIIGTIKKRESKNRVLFSILYPLISIVLIMPVLFGWFLITIREFHTEYPSPSGEKVVVLEYNLVSTPSVYLRQGNIFMKRLPVQNLYGGVNETKHCEITWISENEFEIRRYDNEEPIKYRFE